MQQAVTYQIGGWRFDPAGHELTQNGIRRQLEPRTARLLQILCERRGAVITIPELIDDIWDGRSVSKNSVAVVVSDLRRALDDDARAPRLIRTVAKGGYRLIEDGEANGEAANGETAPPGRFRLIAAGAAVAVMFAVAVFLSRAGDAPVAVDGPPVIITVNNMSNQTGIETFDTATSAISELAAEYLVNAGNHIVIRDRWRFSAEDPSLGLFDDFDPDSTVYHITGRLIIEDGRPALALFANLPKTDEVVWAETIPFDGDAFAGPLRTALGHFLTAADIPEARTAMAAK